MNPGAMHSRNELEALPASIGSLPALTHLDLSQNRLTAVPDTIVNLQKLEELVRVVRGLLVTCITCDDAPIQGHHAAAGANDP